MITYKPHHDRVLIKPAPSDEQRAGLELLQHDREPKSEGVVVAVGQGVPLHEINLKVTGDVNEATIKAIKEVVELIENGRKLRCRPGDRVLYGRYAGTKIVHNGEEHIIIREADVFMTIEETDDAYVENQQEY